MMRKRKIPFLGFLASTASGSVAVCLVTYICFHFHLNLTITSFLYLMIVVLQSMRGSFASSALVSLLTVACLDFFFTEPIFSFQVTDSLDILALISYLTTGLVITRLTTRARREKTISDHQRHQIDLLYELARQLLALDPEQNLLQESVERFRSVFNLKAICLFDALNGKSYTVGKADGELCASTRSICHSRRDEDNATTGYSVRCLHASGTIVGAVAFVGLRGYELTIGPLAALAAAMLERARGFQRASHAAAAAQAEVFRGAVLDALAHEFKTPLATILTAAGGLQTLQPRCPQQRELTELIEAETSRLSELTSHVLRTSQLDPKEVKPRLQRTDIGSLVNGMVDHFSTRWADRRFHLRKETDSAEVLADSELLELAFKQLLDNACKYSPPGSHVEVSIERCQENAAVRVLNSGGPIRGHDRARIFERFCRGTATGSKVPGSGLGLYIAREIVHAHGGRVELEDTATALGTGTAFRLTLPLAQSEY